MRILIVPLLFFGCAAHNAAKIPAVADPLVPVFDPITNQWAVQTPLASSADPGFLSAPDKRAVASVVNAASMSGATDTDKIAAAIAYVKANFAGVGTVIVPATFDKAATLPLLALTANQSMSVIDYRLNRTSPAGTRGSLLIRVEDLDGNGGYNGQVEIQCKQNPALILDGLSDGTAHGYPAGIQNKMASVIWQSHETNLWQLVTDSVAKGEWDIQFYQYSDGAGGSIALDMSPDNNFKTRFDFTPILLVHEDLNITGATNTTPIVITVANPHIYGPRSPFAITGVTGNTAANGNWLADQTGPTTFALRGSIGNGTYTGGGIANTIPNAHRATMNVPAIQAGKEAIVAEGDVVIQGGELATDTGLRIGAGANKIRFMAAVPVSAAWILGDRIYTTAPVPGGTEGWVCTTAGTANNVAWQGLHGYSVLGVQVTNGTNVYEVITVGTSAASPGPTGTGADIVDGTVHWKYIGGLAAFKIFGTISA